MGYKKHFTLGKLVVFGKLQRRCVVSVAISVEYAIDAIVE